MVISVPALAASRRDQLLTSLDEILQHEPFFRVDHNGSGRNVDRQVASTASLLIGAATSIAIIGFPEFSVSDRGQMIDAIPRLDDDAPPFATVSAVWPAQRHVLLTTKTDAAITATACLQIDLNSVNEHGCGNLARG